MKVRDEAARWRDAPKSCERAPRSNLRADAWSVAHVDTENRSSSDGLVAFSLLACALTWGLAAPMTLAWMRHVPPPGYALPCAGLAAFGPLIAAAIVAGKQGRLRAAFGRWRAPVPWVLLALLTPLLVHVTALGLATAFGVAPVAYLHPPSRPEQMAAFVVFPFGEELGWRGFAYPRFVARYGALRGAMSVGVLWAVWHLAYAVTPEAGRFDAVTLLMLLSLLPLYSVILAWMTERTGGGLALALAFHAGGHLDNLQLASRADLRLHVAHFCVVLPLALAAGRALAKPAPAQP